jgi:hypothetical protein
MFKHLMKIAWFGLLASYIAIWATLRREVSLTGSYEWIAWLGILGFVFWAYLAFRLSGFSGKFRNFSRQIIAGNYETGIRPTRFVRDEVCSLEALINKIADRLRFFDALRAEKVAISTRAREIIHERSCESIVFADVDAAVFRFNKEARAFFGVDQETLSFDAIEKRPENAAFSAFFRDTIERDKVPHGERLAISLPVRGAAREAFVEIVPIKDRLEKVRVALIFLREPDREPAA